MILGVYWYFKFPEGLYNFQYFKFLKGIGSRVNNLAELETKVSVNNIDQLLIKLENLKLNYSKAYLNVKINGNQLIINTGEYNLYDYHFQMISEIEQILQSEDTVLMDNEIRFETQLTKNLEADWNGKFDKKKHNFIQIIGSDFKKYNAENLSLRIDCNLPLISKKKFMIDLIQICREENIFVFYYNECEFENHINLMLFFSNGRQTKENIQIVNINSFGHKVELLTQKYNLKFGYTGEFKYYPSKGPHLQLIVDEEFIISHNNR
ncbi:hypothetical protein ACM39_11750 [Chryseobacterium sp. FH2]|uniref:hypothetical protein n=1 Tax=Chryseobacterium sp. FH2 TaxID=1674291 RepID=UPI00065AC36F|nr:hypothetical protein [Chryseobacterium sp. FH2]KMQ67543.1 hypothetical protein ACM39_11750 [Chryseobacterium sp. FH2]